MTHGEFIIPTTCGSATRGRNYTIPNPPPEGIAAVHETESLFSLVLNLKMEYLRLITGLVPPGILFIRRIDCAISLSLLRLKIGCALG